MVKQQQYRHLVFLIPYLITYSSICYSFQNGPPTNINEAMFNVFNAEDHPYLVKKNFLSNKATIEKLYYFSTEPFIWLNKSNETTKKINSIFKLISTAKERGLNEDHYNLNFLRDKWEQLKTQQSDNLTNTALLDTALSFNLLHFLSDLKFGRINPQTLNFNFKPKKNLSAFIPLILNAIHKNEIDSLADKVEPRVPVYQQLKTALSDYRKLNTTQEHNYLNFISTIRPEDSSSQIIAIRQKLNILGIPTDKNNSASCLYDKKLVDIIKDLQLRHGLKVDGVIGKKTIAALSPTLTQRIQQIELALERLRWLPNIQPGPLIMVNIPAYQLWAYDSDKLIESKALNMKVIVGKSEELLKSPIFSADMFYLEFSPYWNIPKSITFKEIIPKLEENPWYIEEKNMELVTGFHNSSHPIPYTDYSIEQLKDLSLKLRQRPGKGNALGKVKFIFPNSYSVYLHDTSSRRLFNKSRRDLSHGCIRVEKPTALANFLLKTKPGWNQNKTLQSMKLTRPKQVRLAKAIPVIIFYSTAFYVEDKINFYEDIYGYDTKLSAALFKHHSAQVNSKLSTILPVPDSASIDMNKI